MSEQFWWGLAALPLGALALAISVFLPWLCLAWASDRRRRHTFVWSETKRGRKAYRSAALVAMAQHVVAVNLPLGHRITWTRDRRGMSPLNRDAFNRVHDIEEALKEIDR